MEKKKSPRLTLLMRHGEKPARSLGEPGLSALGRQHALELAKTIPILYGVPDVVFAAASDAGSSRCVETAQPIVGLLDIPLHDNIPAKDVDRLVYAIKNQPYGDFVQVIWRHEQLPAISQALGFPPPFKKWAQSNFTLWWALSHDFDYFENDGSYFRGRVGQGAVEDIWMGDGWEKYKGDCARRYLFGNKIELASLPIAAGGEGRRPANVRYYKDGEAKAEAEAADNETPKRRTLPSRFRETGAPGDAFVITGASKPKP